MDTAAGHDHSADVEIVLAALAVWLLGNLVAVLAWAGHRGAFTRAPVALPSVQVPVQRAPADAPARRPTATV